MRPQRSAELQHAHTVIRLGPVSATAGWILVLPQYSGAICAAKESTQWGPGYSSAAHIGEDFVGDIKLAAGVDDNGGDGRVVRVADVGEQMVHHLLDYSHNNAALSININSVIIMICMHAPTEDSSIRTITQGSNCMHISSVSWRQSKRPKWC